MKLQIAWDKEIIQGLIDVKIINVADKNGNIVENLNEDTWTGQLRIYAISGLTLDVMDIAEDTWYCQVSEGTLLRCCSSRPVRARGASKDYSIHPHQDVRFQEFLNDGAEMLVTFYDGSQVVTAIVKSEHFAVAPSQ